jgi:hypothetical protein
MYGQIRSIINFNDIANIIRRSDHRDSLILLLDSEIHFLTAKLRMVVYGTKGRSKVEPAVTQSREVNQMNPKSLESIQITHFSPKIFPPHPKSSQEL